jgi:hypothetical protein
MLRFSNYLDTLLPSSDVLRNLWSHPLSISYARLLSLSQYARMEFKAMLPEVNDNPVVKDEGSGV